MVLVFSEIKELFMKKSVIVGILIAILVFSFSCKKESTVKSKYDPTLRHYLESQQIQATPEKLVPIIGTCFIEITDSLRSVLEKNGARVGTTRGKFFTADIPKSKINKIASLAEVRYLQLAPKAKPAN